MVRFDVALTVSVMRYVSDLHLGRVNPRLFHFELDIDHTNFDVSQFLREKLLIASSTEIDAAIEELEPPFPTYRRTRDVLRTYLEFTRCDLGGLFPVPRKAIRPGDSYAGLPRLTRLLTLFGDLPEREKCRNRHHIPGSGGSGGEALSAATRSGAEQSDRCADGQDLNTPISHRVTQLQLTLERLRWLPHQFQRPPVVVNIPEFRLRAVDEQYHWVALYESRGGSGLRAPDTGLRLQHQVSDLRPLLECPAIDCAGGNCPTLKKDPAYLTRTPMKSWTVQEPSSVWSRSLIRSSASSVPAR